RHAGVHRFTVGQRRGLGLGCGHGTRRYVRALDASTATVTVSEAAGLRARGLVARDVSWTGGPAPAPDTPLAVRIRHRHPPVPAPDAADAESRRLARRARREHPAARVILTGCYAQTKAAEAAAEPAVDHVIGLNRLEALVAAVTAPLPAVARVVVGNARRERTVTTFGARTFAGQTRAFLKVQEGCDLFCTFCIIPLARGASRSLAPRDVR